jgi:hypothetical protein
MGGYTSGCSKCIQFNISNNHFLKVVSCIDTLRCQAQLELTLMMCLSDRSTSTGALSDYSTFTSTDVRTTDLRHCFFGRLVVV